MAQLASNPGDSVCITRVISNHAQIPSHVLKRLELVNLRLPLSIYYCGPEETKIDQETHQVISTDICPIILGSNTKESTYVVRVDEFLEIYTQQRGMNDATYFISTLLENSKSQYLYIAKKYCEFIPAQQLQLAETYDVPRA